MTVSSTTEQKFRPILFPDSYRSIMKIQFEEFDRYLAGYSAKTPPNVRSTARAMLARLTISQVAELSMDVYDELIRRNENQVPFLPAQPEFHHKRNQARQKLATMPNSRFEDLSGDIHFELARRYPELKKDVVGIVDDVPGVLPYEVGAHVTEDSEGDTSETKSDDYGKENDFSSRLSPTNTSEVRKPTFPEGSLVLDFVDTILQNREEYQALLKVDQTQAQSLLDLFQILSLRTDLTTRLRSSILKAMLRLSKASGQCPSLLAINDFQKDGDKPLGSGGYCDIWKGRLGTEVVCLKLMRVYRESDIDKIVKDSMREAIIWRQLDHPNLLPFHGLYLQDHKICLISPWVANGSLTHFLEDSKRAGSVVIHETLIWDIANGLSYLHERKLVHADLKGDNVLITSHGRACIADFGLSRLTDSQVLAMSSNTRTLAGTLRWTAPEILISEGRHTYQSDVYAFGCVCYEIYSGLRPFHDLRSDGAVILQVHLGKRPSRPRNAKLTDKIWSFIEACWATDPLDRPESGRLMTVFKDTLEDIGEIVPAPIWDQASLCANIWSKLRDRGGSPDQIDVAEYLFQSAIRVWEKQPGSES